ncbi:hypothetical protein [Salarchaeum sp. JOR-1]|uniref:hypothetical protein n=1 Tax=Salarchaeum sp. JOR-1 TaxID=2599399 RepID=UPI001198C933|nr:hypothetical protein [Salarchaeum sp. JOR-1]QDX41771.1 hypothetical protein FQU85_12970 [Salarchaeum sp. JOR-1]
MTDHSTQQPLTTWTTTNTDTESKTEADDTTTDTTTDTDPSTDTQAKPPSTDHTTTTDTADTPTDDTTTTPTTDAHDADDDSATTPSTTASPTERSAAATESAGTAASPFDFTKSASDDSHPLTRDGSNALTADTLPSPPLADQINTLATHPPEPTTHDGRLARACYVIARAQTGSLPGYSLQDSMVPLRDHLEAELDIDFTALIDQNLLTEKRLNGHAKYYRVTDRARSALHTSDHPNPGVLDDTLPILRDGPLHNRAILEAANWLQTTQPITHITTPYAGTPEPIDFGGSHNDTLRWLGEAVAAEDDLTAVCNRLKILANTDANVIVVVENSTVASNLLDALATTDLIDIPPDIAYHNFSIAQFHTRLFPQLDNLPVDELTALTTLTQ